MEVEGKYFIVEKHLRRNGLRKRRRFNDASELDVMKSLAEGYAEQRGEDFLIVQVVAEVSKPKVKKEG